VTLLAGCLILPSFQCSVVTIVRSILTSVVLPPPPPPPRKKTHQIYIKKKKKKNEEMGSYVMVYIFHMNNTLTFILHVLCVLKIHIRCYSQFVFALGFSFRVMMKLHSLWSWQPKTIVTIWTRKISSFSFR
jgi:hypothetical protein